MDMVLTECINACNELSRHGGFSPAQWVIGRQPRVPGSQADQAEADDIGVLQAQTDGPTQFGIQTKYRESARNFLSSGTVVPG